MNLDAFWGRVEKTSTCWLWQGYVTKRGYGTLTLAGKTYRAHRLAFDLLRGSIPAGKQIDHVCRVRHCVNPDHMEIVDQTTNIRRGVSPTAINRRKTHCPYGHTYDRIRPNGYRECRQCRRDAKRRRKERRRLAALPPSR